MEMTQLFESLSLTGNTWVEFPAPSFRPAQSWPLLAFGSLLVYGSSPYLYIYLSAIHNYSIIMYLYYLCLLSQLFCLSTNFFEACAKSILSFNSIIVCEPPQSPFTGEARKWREEMTRDLPGSKVMESEHSGLPSPTLSAGNCHCSLVHLPASLSSEFKCSAHVSSPCLTSFH